MESRAFEAARNANFGPREAEVLYRAQGIMGQRNEPQGVVINVDIVPAEEGEIEEEEEEDEEPAGGANEEEEESDPDDATYDPDTDKDDGYDGDSIPPLVYGEDSSDDESDDEDDPTTQRRPIARSRGGRAIRRPDRLNLLELAK